MAPRRKQSRWLVGCTTSEFLPSLACMSGRDPRLSQPPTALLNCFCLHPLGRACSASVPPGEGAPLSLSLQHSSPRPGPSSKAQALSIPRTTWGDLVPFPQLTPISCSHLLGPSFLNGKWRLPSTAICCGPQEP